MKLKKLNVRKKPISPLNSGTLEDFNDDDVCSTDSKESPIRNTANARERARMRVLSSAFYRLKTIIPWVPHDTKLSKLDTLRLARNYIAYLSATLAGENVNDITNKMPHPQKMTWPYIFQQVPELVSDLNANKVSNSTSTTTSRKENSSKKIITAEMTSIESSPLHRFSHHDHHTESHLLFYKNHNNNNNNMHTDDFELSYD